MIWYLELFLVISKKRVSKCYNLIKTDDNMKKSIFIAVSFFLMITSCGNKSNQALFADHQINTAMDNDNEQGKIPYIVAQRYFVKNTVDKGFKTLKITSKDEFDRYFGMAAVMDKDGKPTSIDFSQQYVIAIINNESNKDKNITLTSLTQDSNKIKLQYKIIVDDEVQAFTKRLALILVIDKKYDKEIEFDKN